MAQGGGGGGGGDGAPWLGLLKWSLNYVDGTRPSDETQQPMSAEDRAFLEKVMKEGIIDPGARMKVLLSQLTESFRALLSSSSSEGEEEDGDGDSNSGGRRPPNNTITTTPEEKEEEQEKEEHEDEEGTTTRKILNEDGMITALEELRDIVEQIDYARDFVKMNGLPFLLGCAAHDAKKKDGDGGDSSAVIPISVRMNCLGVLSTLSQNNPPVQQSMLELDGLSILSRIYVNAMNSSPGTNEDVDGSFRTRVMQTFSCMVRGYKPGEETFCQNEYCRAIIDRSLGLGDLEAPSKLKKKTVFFLGALLTSDFTTRRRIRDFEHSIRRMVDFIDPASASSTTKSGSNDGNDDVEIRETSLSIILKLLEQKISVNTILDERDRIVGIGVRRISELRGLPPGSEEKEISQHELSLWEGLITELAKASFDQPPSKDDDDGGDDEKTASPPSLMLGP